MKVTSIPYLKTVIKDTNDKLATACKYFSIFCFTSALYMSGSIQATKNEMGE